MLSAFAGPLAVDRRVGVRVGVGDRRPQPRARPPAAARTASSTAPVDDARRDVLPPVLGARHRARPRGHGGDARVRRAQPGHRRARRRRAGRARCDSRSWPAAACTTSRASGCCGSACPPRAASAAGVIAVAPSQFGVAAFSPRLDAHGNSVRASAVVEHAVGPIRDASARAAREPRGARHLGGPDRATGRVVRLGGELGFAGRGAGPRRCCASSPPARRMARSSRSMSRELARTHPAALVALQTEFDGLRPEGAPAGRRARRSPDQTRRSSVIDIASVLCRCGHSCARPEPSACGGRPGSASATRREHLARVELLDRVAELAAHFGDDAGRLGEVRRARDVRDDAAGLERRRSRR